MDVRGLGGLVLGEVRRGTAVLLDRDRIWLSALEGVVGELGFVTIGMLTVGSEALSLIREQRPDLFVLDIEIDGSADDGVEIVREACLHVPAMKTVVVSASEDQELIAAAFGAGAAGYVFKRAEPIDLSSTVRQVFKRSLHLADAVQPVYGQSSDENPAGLTPREREILRHVAEGGTNVEVARKLWVTEQTVKFHLSNVYRKLNVSNRTEAGRWAHAHGLLAARAAEVNSPQER